MILNNLFYITTKVRGEEQCSHSTSENENDGLTDWLMDPLINRDAFIFSFVFVLFWLQYSNSHTREIEEIWGSLCQFWPNNLKVILRYLVIISGMAPNELLPFVSPFNILFMCSSVWTTQQEHTSLFTCPLQYWGELPTSHGSGVHAYTCGLCLCLRLCLCYEFLWAMKTNIWASYLLFQAKRVALYLARACPNRLLDELMTELQTVETLNCLIERTETPPFYRLTSMRKASSHSDGKQFWGGKKLLKTLAQYEIMVCVFVCRARNRC